MNSEREAIITLIDEARASGARQSKACECIGISAKTLQRWSRPESTRDGRLDAKHAPGNKLTELERQRIIKVTNEPEYADLSPSKIVPKLADKGIYIASGPCGPLGAIPCGSIETSQLPTSSGSRPETTALK
jgi:transposase-like protein